MGGWECQQSCTISHLLESTSDLPVMNGDLIIEDFQNGDVIICNPFRKDCSKVPQCNDSIKHDIKAIIMRHRIHLSLLNVPMWHMSSCHWTPVHVTCMVDVL